MRRALPALAALALAVLIAIACTVEVHVYDETGSPESTGEAGAP